MFGTEDKFKKFNDDVGKILQSHRDAVEKTPVLNKEQFAAANSAKAELAEKRIYTIETRNSVLKNHLFTSSNGTKITPDVVKAFSDIALGG